jgi:hypothetical protein
MNKFDKLFNGYIEYFSRTKFAKIMARLAMNVIVLINLFVRFVENTVLPYLTASFYWLDAKFVTKAIKNAGFSMYQPAYLQAEISKYGEDGFKLLNEVSHKTIYTYVEVRHMLPLIEPDWKSKSSDELAGILMTHFYHQEGNADAT